MDGSLNTAAVELVGECLTTLPRIVHPLGAWELEVGPAYGLTVLSEPGQDILAQHGLIPVALHTASAEARP